MVTGASSGIGRALAVAIARRGARVGLIARRASVLDEVVSEIDSNSGMALAIAADVQDAEALRTATHHLAETFGPIDMLIANAGIGTTTHSSKLEPDEVASVLRVNVIGAANSVAAVLPQMISRRQGHLVAIASLAAYRGLAKSGAYCASKAALSALFESLRIDLRGSGVNVTIIYPGFIKTPLTAGRARMPYLLELDEAVEKIIRAIERQKKSYSFPWQLATIMRAGLIMPAFMYDWIAARNSFRE
ncbi:MAG TPA: SDR family NAD(P)-dependent oxidoreductase [Pyrinomonadaceae bacterium]